VATLLAVVGSVCAWRMQRLEAGAGRPRPA
jgi:hypothetical protein